MKRLLVSFICLLLAFSLSGISFAKTVLNWFAPMTPGPELDLWKGLIAEFEKRNPDIEVKLSIEPWGDYWPKIATMFAGGQHPDMVWMHYSRFKDYAAQGALRPLDDYIRRDKAFASDLAQIPAVLKRIFQHDGKQYVLPKDHGGIAVWYNMDMFDQAGVKYPWQGWTWKDFLTAAQKLTKDFNGDGVIDQWGTTDLMFGGEPASWWHHEMGWAMIKSFGGDTYSDDYKSVFIDKPETIEAIQFMADCINKYKVAPTSDQIAGLGPPFRIGKTAMSCFPHAAEGYWIRYEKRPVKRYGVEFLPKGKGGVWYALGATGFAIPSGSKAPDAAWKFIKYALSKEVAEKVAEHYRWGTHRMDLWAKRFELQVERGIYIEENWKRVWVDAVINPTKTGVHLGYARIPAGAAEINTILRTEFDPVYLGKRTAAEAAKAAKPKILEVLKKFYK